MTQDARILKVSTIVDILGRIEMRQEGDMAEGLGLEPRQPNNRLTD